MNDTATQPRVHDCHKIASGLYLEGLAFDAPRNLIWYSDVIAGGIHAITPEGEAVFRLNPDRLWTGGIMMNHDGAVLSSGPEGIMWNKPDEGTSGWLVSEHEGAPLMGVNEMVSDGHGGIYFGTIDIPQIAKGEPTSPSFLYRLGIDRKLTRIAGPLGFTNGIMRSLDGAQLFYNDTFDAPYVFPLAPDGTLGERRRLLDKDDCDGMAMDAEGNVLITGYKSDHIVRIAPDGTLLEPLSTVPGAAVTQIRFAGADMRDVYLNCVPLDAGDSLAVGESPTAERSFLLRGRVEQAGLPLAPAQFKL